MATENGVAHRIDGGAKGGAWALAHDRILLLKPRVMSLVVFTGAVGAAVAPGQITWPTFLAVVACIAVGAGACGALNMWWDADIDGVMRRTASRPIPTGRVTAREALVIGTVLSLGSVACCTYYVNGTAAALLALTIGFYVFVYTMGLKRRTPQNIVIGGAAGAFPPMVGWAATTGSVDAGSLALFAIIFLWTPPHFWALALFRSGDYARAGVPMLPVVAGADETTRQILLYSILLMIASLAPFALGFEGPVYAVAAVALGAGFMQRAIVLRRAPDAAQRERAAKKLFGWSILYLFVLFVALLAGAR